MPEDDSPIARAIMRVPGEGLEPSWAEAHGILSAACLPVSPSRREAIPRLHPA